MIMKNSLKILLAVISIVLITGCLEQKEKIQNVIPDVLTTVDSYNPPAYRGNSTIVNFAISGINVKKGNEISLDYKTEMVHTNGSLEAAPDSVHLIPDQKPLIFKRTANAGEAPEKLYSNLTVTVDKTAADGDYYITISGRDKGLAIESLVLSFKIGKGGKLPLPEKNVWTIGYTREQIPPLSEEEKAEAVAIAVNDTSLKGKNYSIFEVVRLNFYDIGNFSGFFPVVIIEMEDANGWWYVIDLEEKKILRSDVLLNDPIPKVWIFTSDYDLAKNPNIPSIGRGRSTLINLTIRGSVSKGTKVYLNYSVYARYPDGSTEKNPKEVDLFIEPNVVVFQKECTEGCELHSSLVVNVSQSAKQGLYQIYFEGRPFSEDRVNSEDYQFVLGK